MKKAVLCWVRERDITRYVSYDHYIIVDAPKVLRDKERFNRMPRTIQRNRLTEEIRDRSAKRSPAY